MASERIHLPGRERCPHLPEVTEVWTAERMAVHRGDYGPRFYVAALSFAQSLWLEGKPAQALLQMNKALMADLLGEEPELAAWALPYGAKAWVLRRAQGGEFLGNPVRHYQHLATRMSGPRAELRTWRAWACFHLAEQILDSGEFPRDERQIAKEAIEVPGREVALEHLARCGLPQEATLLADLLAGR